MIKFSQKPNSSSTEKLLTSGYYKSINGIFLGGLQTIWGLVLLPRIMPYPEVFGIIATVGVIINLIGILIDWGVWTAIDVKLAAAYGSQNMEEVEKYVRTVIGFKIINGLIFNLIIDLFLILIFPIMNLDYKNAYYIYFFLIAIRWFGGFAVISERILLANQRFDYEFYYQTINFLFLVSSRIFWFYTCNKIYPKEPIIAFTIAIAISETIETFFNWFTQAMFLRRAKLLKFSRVLKPQLNKEVLSYIFHYGKFVMSRQYLLLFSEVNSTLWVFLVRLMFQNPESIIGIWSFALGSMGPFFMAGNLTAPILPAISDAYHRKDWNLIQEYWITAFNWFCLWSICALGMFIRYAELIVVVVSGPTWRLAGVVCMLISPAFLFKLGNELLYNILYGSDYPKGVLISTCIKIPILLVGGLLLFKNLVLMSVVFFIIEFSAFLNNYRLVKKRLKIQSPKKSYIIPIISSIITLLILEGLNYLLIFDESVKSLVLVYGSYLVIFFIVFILLGGFEEKDFDQFKGSLNQIFRKGKMAERTINLLKKIAQKSPFYINFEKK